MERDVDDSTFGKDVLRLTEAEVADLEDEIDPDAHGHVEEAFEKVVIELESGRELEFTGYGGASAITLAVNGIGLNRNSCVSCEEEKHERALKPIRHNDDDKPTVYICRECRQDQDNPIMQFLTEL